MKNIYKALFEFQQECPIIHKGTQGYGYSYSSLTEIFNVIMPLLKKHGLGFTQCLVGESLVTTVFHVESGEKIESAAHIPQDVTLAKMNQYQVLGSAVTYFRRYTLSAMLGLITDADTDAYGQQVHQQQQQQQQQTQTSTKGRKKLDTNHPKYDSAIQKLSRDETTIAEIMKYFDVTEEDIISDVDMIKNL